MALENEIILEEVFLSNEDKPSARIYKNLASSPVIHEILKRKKKLSYSDMALISSSIVASLDDQIETLEKKQKVAEKVAGFINEPLFVKQSTDNDNANTQHESKPDELREQHWFLKYLTLRNILAITFIVVTSGASFFSWYNQDYKSQIGLKNGEIKELQEKLKNSNYNISNLKGEIKILKDKYESQDEKIKKSKLDLDASNQAFQTLKIELENTKTDHSKEINELQQKYNQDIDTVRAQLTQTSDVRVASLTDQIKNLTNSLSTVTKEKNSFNQQYNKVSGELSLAQADIKNMGEDVEHWKAKYDAMKVEKDAYETKVGVKDKQLSELEEQRNSARSAWNLLLGYLKKKDVGGRWGTAKLDREDTDDYIKTLESYSSKVTGMTKKINDSN